MSTYKNIYLTRTGAVTLKGELRNLRRKLTDVSRDLKAARQDGEFENGDLEVAENEYDQVSHRIEELSDILTRAKTLRPTGRSVVVLGSRVTLREQGGGRVIYQIVESVEADPAASKISDRSPLGRQLVGRMAGDTVRLVTATRNHTYTIDTIS